MAKHNQGIRGLLPEVRVREPWGDDESEAARRPPARRVTSRSSSLAVSIDRYRDDALYPRIVRAVEVLLARGTVVAPVDVLVEMGMLKPSRLEDWRFGRVPYLEKVVQGNLTRLSRLLRILRLHAHDLNLVPSVTAYTRWGKGRKQRLRFTKTGDKKLDEAYSRHFFWPGKEPFRPRRSRAEQPATFLSIDNQRAGS